MHVSYSSGCHWLLDCLVSLGNQITLFRQQPKVNILPKSGLQFTGFLKVPVNIKHPVSSFQEENRLLLLSSLARKLLLDQACLSPYLR